MFGYGIKAILIPVFVICEQDIPTKKKKKKKKKKKNRKKNWGNLSPPWLLVNTCRGDFESLSSPVASAKQQRCIGFSHKKKKKEGSHAANDGTFHLSLKGDFVP
jgi:hypothetical protein